jgi:hypothetical protein
MTEETSSKAWKFKQFNDINPAKIIVKNWKPNDV